MYDKIEKALIEIVKENYLPKRKRFSLAFYAKAADELSKAFTSERSKRAKNYFNSPPFRAAYLLYFYLQTFGKVKFVVNEVKKLGFKIDNALDIGAGSGAAALAAALAGSKKLTLIDQNKKALIDAEKIAKKVTKKTNWISVSEDMVSWKNNDKFDLALAVNFFNEIPKSKRLKMANRILKHSLTKNGVLVIVEPALRFTTRELMELRDLLISEGYFVHAPCLHEKPCPMLRANKRDWCHLYLRWTEPKLISNMDKLIHRNHKYLKLSYMIVSSKKPKSHTNIGRIVSSPLVSKGKTEILVCNANGSLDRLRELHREKDQKFKNYQRGALITL